MTDMEDSDEESSGSSISTSSDEKIIFMPAARPLILELHDIRKDDPLTPKLKPSDSIPHLGATSIKIKKHKKGKKKAVPGAKSNTSVSTASLSDTSSIAPSATDVVEEFYDAHESYHAIPENQISVLAAENMTLLDTNQEPAQAAAPAAISPKLGEKATELAAVTTELASATSQPNKTETPAKALATSPVIKPTEPP